MGLRVKTVNTPTSDTMNVLSPNKEKDEKDKEGGSRDSYEKLPVGGSSTSTIKTAPSPTQQQKPASSGTFTNLQQYSQANQGGAQRMAQAATQNVAQQAGQVQKTATQQAARTQSDIAANQAKIAQEQEFAKKQLERAGTAIGREDIESYEKSKLGKDYDKFKEQEREIQNRVFPMDIGPGSSNEAAMKRQQKDLEALRKEYSLDYIYNPNDEDYERFRNIVTGQTQYNQVRDLDLAQQRIQAQQLQQQAQQAGTDAGRMALLQQTLGKGREYSRGLQTLDSALIARDAAARQSLQQGIQQSSEQTQQALQGIQTDVNARRQALQRLNQEYGQTIMTEGDAATADVMTAVNSGMISIQKAREALAKDLGITEAEAETRMKAMAQERLDMQAKGKVYGVAQYNSWSPAVGGYRYRNLMDTADQGIALSKAQQEALQIAGIDPSLRISDSERNWLRSRGFYSWSPDSALYNYNAIDADSDQGTALRSAYDRMFGGEAKALQAAKGSETLARQLGMMEGADVAGLQGGVNELYSNLKSGKDINLETAASLDQYRRYNALQDLIKGRDIGDRQLRMSEMEENAGKAAAQQTLLENARKEAMRKLGIG